MNLDNNILLYSLSLLSAGLIAYFFYFYKNPKKEVSNYFKASLAFLRFLSLFGLLVLLINPKFKFEEDQVQNNKLVVFVDQSKSLSAYQQEIKTLVNKLKDDVDDELDVEMYTFGSKTSFLNTSVDSLKFTDLRTNLSNLNTFIEKNIPASIHDHAVLISDGIVNEGSFDGLNAWKGNMNSILVGDTQKIMDIGVVDLIYPSVIQKGNSFNIKYYVKTQNYLENDKTLIQWFKSDSLIGEQYIKLNKNQSWSGNFTYNSPLNKSASFSLKIKNINKQCNQNPYNDIKSFYISVVEKKAKILIYSKGAHPDIKAISSVFKNQSEFDFKVFNEAQKNDFLNQLDSSDLCIYHNTKVINLNKPFWQITSDASLIDCKEIVTSSFNERSMPFLNKDFNVFYLNNKQKENIYTFVPLNTIMLDKHSLSKSNIILFQKIGQINTELPLLFFTKDQTNAYALCDNIWQWKMSEVQKSDAHLSFDALVYNVVKTLSEKKKSKRFEWENKKDFNINEEIKLQFRYLDLLSNPIHGQEILVSIRDENNKEVFNQTAIELNNNYLLNLPQLEEGVFFAEILNKKGENKSFSFIVKEDLLEQVNLEAQKDYLMEIAKAHNGSTYFLASTQQLEKELKILKNKPKSVVKIQRYKSLIDWPILLFIITICLGLEWLLRKFYHRV